MVILLLFILLLVAFYFLVAYNRFVTLKTRIQASIQEIGNQLKRQADLIPNLEASVKGYLKHEKEIYKELTEARKAVEEAVSEKDVGKMVAASNQLQKALGNLRVVVESTPQIRGVEAVIRLMDELRDTADKVMYSRRNLIDLVADYNILRVTFPSNIIANLFHFEAEKGLELPKEENYLKVSEKETETPKVSF